MKVEIFQDARESGEWVQEKLERIERYITMFCGVGKKWKGNLSFVELFGGFGKNELPDGRQLDGTPLLASGCKIFKKIVICEEESKALKSLEGYLAGDSRIKIISGDCNESIEKVRGWIPANNLVLTIADSTGTQLKMSTLEALTKNRKMDLILFFPVQALHQNLPNWYKANSSVAVDDYFGTKKWRQVFEAANQIPSKATSGLMDLYRTQLRLMGYKYFGDPLSTDLIRSEKNKLPLYTLLYASKDERGEDFWNKSLPKANRHGQGRLF